MDKIEKKLRITGRVINFLTLVNVIMLGLIIGAFAWGDPILAFAMTFFMFAVLILQQGFRIDAITVVHNQLYDVFEIEEAGLADKDKIIYELWKLLDDIDSLSDIAKSNNLWYREQAEHIQKKRRKIEGISEEFLDRLYGEYYK